MTIGKTQSSEESPTASAYDGTWSGSALLSSNLRAGLRLDRQDSSFGLSLHRQITPGLHDSRSLEFSGARVITNFDHYRADARFRLAPEFEIDGGLIYQVNGSSDSMILRRNLGGEIGVRTPAFFSRVRVMGTLQNDINLNYLPGGSAPVNATLEVGRGFRISDSFRLDTSGSINIDSYGQGGAFLNFGLSYDHY